jgi:hypothetical protein
MPFIDDKPAPSKNFFAQSGIIIWHGIGGGLVFLT